MRSYSVFLSLSDISLSIMSSKSIHIVKWQYFLLSHLWIIFWCVYVPIFLFHSSFNGHPSYFHTYDFLVYCRAASCVILRKPWPHFLCIYFCYLLIWLHWILVAACGTYFPDQELNPGPLLWETGVLAIGPPWEVPRTQLFWKSHFPASCWQKSQW